MVFADESPAILMSLSDYGAIPSDGMDDSAALVKALSSAKNLAPKPVTILMDEGRYEFLTLGNDQHKSHIQIYGFSDLTIRGKGPQTELIMSDSKADGIVINSSSAVRIEQLSIDYQPLPYTQGSVVVANEKDRTFDIQIDEGFNSPLTENLVTQKGRKTRAYLFRPSDNKLTSRFSDQYPLKVDGNLEKRLEKTSDGNYRFFSVNSVTHDFVGYKVVVVGRSRYDAIKVNDSSKVTINAVDIYSSPSTGFKIRNSVGRTIVSNSRIIPKPNSERLLSTNADGLHAKFNRAPIILKNSHMEAMGDDGVNIGGAYQGIYKQLADNILLVEPHRTLKKDDTITVTNRKTGVVKSVAIIKEVERVSYDERDLMKLTLKSSVKSVITVNDGAAVDDSDQITSINTTGQNSLIMNNRFKNIRGRGIMLHGEYSIVKGNHFASFRGPGVVIGPDFWWGESSSASHSIIKDNTFDDIYWNNIIVHGGNELNKSGKLATDDLLIEGNRFTNYGRPSPLKGRGEVGPVLFLKNASNTIVRNNTFGEHFEEGYNGPLIILEMVRDISISDNIFSFKPEKWLEYRQGVEVETVEVN
tara:strand:- start:6090 stop:7844 length:1755 start_codon:yes stop_codon:yes gene_type:complete